MPQWISPGYRRLRTHLAYPAGWSQGAHAGDGQEQPLSGSLGHPS